MLANLNSLLESIQHGIQLILAIKSNLPVIVLRSIGLSKDTGGLWKTGNRPPSSYKEILKLILRHIDHHHAEVLITKHTGLVMYQTFIVDKFFFLF